MIYIVPKIRDNNYDNKILWIKKLNDIKKDLKISKSFYPRFENSSKRGKPGCMEIINQIGALDNNDAIGSLIWALHTDLSFEMIENRAILFIRVDLSRFRFFNDKDYFFYDTKEQVSNTLLSQMAQKDIFIDPVKYLIQHAEQLVLTDKQKIKILKYILEK
tara:strand:+ start:70 stop:552 length:483 start_codon:yes stop_codon:yes gene_type:complete